MPAHPHVRHLDRPTPTAVIPLRRPQTGTVELWYALGDGAWLLEGCEVTACTALGAMLVRYRSSDDDQLYEGWVPSGLVRLTSRVEA